MRHHCVLNTLSMLTWSWASPFVPGFQFEQLCRCYFHMWWPHFKNTWSQEDGWHQQGHTMGMPEGCLGQLLSYFLKIWAEAAWTTYFWHNTSTAYYITLHYRHFKCHLHLKWPVVHQQLHVIRNTAHRPSTQASYTASRVRPKRKISCAAVQIAATQIAATLTISFPRWRHMSLTSYWG